MTDPGLRVCASCGAEQGPYGVRCWICRASLPSAEAPTESAPDVAPESAPDGAPAARPPTPPPVPGRYATRRPHAAALQTGNILVLVVCGLLVLGAFFDQPGLGFFLLLFMLPAVIGIAQANADLRRRGGQVSPGALVSAVIVGGMIAVGMSTVSAFVALLLICGGGFDSMNADSLIVFALVVSVAALAGGIYLGSKMARKIMVGSGGGRRRR